MEDQKQNIELQSQEQISKIILDKITFDCPHCYKEINETHLDEKGRYFQFIKEKIRRTTEEEVNYQRSIQKKQLLEQLQAERVYENFVEVIKKNQTIEELTKSNKELKETLSEVKLKAQEDLAKATSYDAIKKLDGFKELEKRVEEYQKENEKLKMGNQPEIQALRETIKNLENNLAEAKSPEYIMDSKLYKELKEKSERHEKKIEELSHPDYIEKSERVKKLEVDREQLNNQIQLLRDQGRMSKKKGEDLEKYILDQLQITYNGTDEITKITRSGEKADIIQTVRYNQLPIGKIVYEAKNDDKWDPKWLGKLETDMIKDQADFGILVATCRFGKPLWKPYPQKNILVSDEDNFIFASHTARLLISNRQRFKEGEKPEERVKKFEEWVREKLPNYLLNLEKYFSDWEKDLGRINTSVKSMEKIRWEIKRSVISQMEMELKEI